MGRLLNTHLIPESLWNAGEEILLIPTGLAEAFVATVDRRGLRALLADDATDGPVGGISKEDTELHFVNRMDGSAARVLLALLDPRSELDTASDTLIYPFSGGVTCVADAPCGAGAGVLCVLSSIAALRERGVLPRVPLEVNLIAADISTHATELASEMLDHLRDSLAAQAISVSVEWIAWDATDVASTTNLVRRAVITSAASSKKLLLIANFSGFLKDSGKRKKVDPQIEELLRYFAGEESSALWLEPDMRVVSAENGIFGWLFKRASESWAWFAKVSSHLSGSDSSFCARAKFKSILRDGTPNVGARVVPIKLESRP